MENQERNDRFSQCNGHKMSGEEVYEKMFGKRDKEYPEEMKTEFIALYENMQNTFHKLHEDRKSFFNKWKDNLCDGHDAKQEAWHRNNHFMRHGHGHFHGHEFFGCNPQEATE